MYKQDLALNNLQGLIWHKTLPTKQQFLLCKKLKFSHVDKW